MVRPTTGGSLALSFAWAQVAQPVYVFWGHNWKWAGAKFQDTTPAAALPRFRARVPDLGLDITGAFAEAGDRELMVRYEIVAARRLDDIMGGGLEFQIDPAALSRPAVSKPALLENGQGWIWPVSASEELRVTFEPPIAKVYFERGNHYRIRCMFLAGDVAPGTRKITMRIRLPEGGEIAAPWDYYYGRDDGPDWMPQTVDPGVAPVDVSFLNDGHRPAGTHGRVIARGDALVFEDGTAVRFWGANVTAHALFAGSLADIRREAKRIAALGHNLVRIHHHDSPWVKPNVFAPGDSTRRLNESALNHLGWWIKCLRDEGVYVWLDLHVGRAFRRGDGVDGFAELERDNGNASGFMYVNATLEKRWREFARDYLTRKNPYTGLSYVEDPAIVAVLITNENDLTHHFGNRMLPDKDNPFHQGLFERLATRFATRNALPMPASLHTWKPGPAKIVLNELEYRFAERSIKHLRRLGTKALVATTNYWGAEPLFALPALTAGDIIDVHSYGGAEFLSFSPRAAANLGSRIGAAQIAGRPLSVTEWNVPFPARDRFVAPLYVASLAALQGWDMPMLYAYQQYPVGSSRDRPDRWSSSIDPALTALMPAAALLYRQGHVQPAKRTFRLQLTREQLYFRSITAKTSAAIRTLVEQSRLVIGLPDIAELDWDGDLSPHGFGDVLVTDVNRDFIPAGKTFVESDTKELVRDWSLGIHTIDTPKTQAASGWIGGRTISLLDATVKVDTAKAVAVVTSLDGNPIRTSDQLLVTTVGQVTTSANGRLPFRSQPVTGTLAIRTKHRGFCAYPVATDGQLFEPVLVESKDGVAMFELPKGFRTHWYVLHPKVSRKCRPRARFRAIAAGGIAQTGGSHGAR